MNELLLPSDLSHIEIDYKNGKFTTITGLSPNEVLVYLIENGISPFRLPKKFNIKKMNYSKSSGCYYLDISYKLTKDIKKRFSK